MDLARRGHRRFFFSSRRRHTRWTGDWSSDVCSSDLDDVLALTLVLNPGLAFGLLASVPTEWRWIVALLSLVALVILVRVALRVLPRGGFADHGAIGLIFGGAIGNLIDRARFGAVIDFLDVHYRGGP